MTTAALCPLASAFRRPECLHSKPLPRRVPRRPTSILCGSLILQASLVDVPGGYSYSTASVALVAAGALPASLPFTRRRTLHLIQPIVGTGALVSAVLWLSQMERRSGDPVARWYDSHHTHSMKAAISVPDPVFKAADRLAKRRRMSRSELYTRAIVALLRTEDEAEITAQLDRAYAEPGASVLPPDLKGLPARILEKEDW